MEQVQGHTEHRAIPRGPRRSNARSLWDEAGQTVTLAPVRWDDGVAWIPGIGPAPQGQDAAGYRGGNESTSKARSLDVNLVRHATRHWPWTTALGCVMAGVAVARLIWRF